MALIEQFSTFSILVKLISWEIIIKKLHHKIVSLVHLVRGGGWGEWLVLVVQIPGVFLSFVCWTNFLGGFGNGSSFHRRQKILPLK